MAGMIPSAINNLDYTPLYKQMAEMGYVELPAIKVKTVEQMIDEGRDAGEQMLKARRLRKLEARWRRKQARIR